MAKFQCFGQKSPKIEKIDFEQLTSTTLEIFRMLGEWIGAAYANAQRFEEVSVEREKDSNRS